MERLRGPACARVAAPPAAKATAGPGVRDSAFYMTRAIVGNASAARDATNT